MSDASGDPGENLWQRMAERRFRFSDCVTVRCITYRGQPSYVLSTSLERQQLRISSSIYHLIDAMGGKKTLAQAGEIHADLVGQSSEARMRIAQLLVKLQVAGMLVSDVPLNAMSITTQHRMQRRQRIWKKRMSLLSPRIPLCNPDPLLTVLQPWCRSLFSTPFLLVWIAACLYGAIQAVVHWEGMSLYGAQRVGDPRSWVLMICVYPLLKALHELGHCLVAKVAGEPVSEMGVTFLVFVPVPYVDASAASAATSKRLRLLVSAAGIMVELFAASVAMAVWLHSQDGLVRELSYVVMVIGGVSTLLFNGNPLLRFDGYFVLSDAIEIPNLAERSSRFYAHLIRRHVLRLPSEHDGTAGERRWFAFYGLVSPIYRVFVCLGIAVLLYINVPVLGVLLALWIVSMQLLYPWGRHLGQLLSDPALEGRRVRLVGAFAGLVVAVVGLSALPLYPSSTLIEGVVLMPEHTVVRAQVDGFVTSMVAEEGDMVREGELLFELSNPKLSSSVIIGKAHVNELQARLDVLSFSDRTTREIYQGRLLEARQELEELEQQQASLRVHGLHRGLFQPLVGADIQGQFIHQGMALGYILDDTDTVIRSVARQQDALQIYNDLKSIEVRLISYPTVTLPGDLLSGKPMAMAQLPSATLGSVANGAIPVDARDSKGLKTLESVFTFDVAANLNALRPFAGSRALVRFHHSPSSLLSRGYGSIKRWVDGVLFGRDTHHI